MKSLPFALAALLAVTACKKEEQRAASPPVATAPTAPPAPAATGSSATDALTPAEPAAATASALVGKPAPDFTLKDLDGNDVSLASLKGKTVVLEWFNPQCPFVVKSHTVGSLVDTAARHTKAGVVWLAINSGAPGKQGHDPALSVEARKAWSLAHPVLRDESGTVGKAYGATNTPNLFVIDKDGTVVYSGAIDNSPDGEKQSVEGGGAVINYVDAALADLAAGTPVRTPVTKPYGCGVKYAS